MIQPGMIFHKKIRLDFLLIARRDIVPAQQKSKFTAQKGWLSAPNGLGKLNAGYHMYFQHNPAAPEEAHHE